MSTSFNIERSWFASRQTTSFTFLSWFVSSFTLKFVLSRENVFGALLLEGKQQFFPVLSVFILWPSRGKHGWDACSKQTTFVRSWFSRQTTGFPVPVYLTASSRKERVSFSWEWSALLFEGKEQVSSFYHDLDLDLIGLIGNLLFVAQLLFLVVQQLLNPNVLPNHVPRKSLEKAAVTHTFSRKWLLQFPSEQLSEYNKLGVFREDW